MNLHERTLSVLACRVSVPAGVAICPVLWAEGGWGLPVQFLSRTEEV